MKLNSGFTLSILSIALALSFTSCQKGVDNGTNPNKAKLQIFLTDDPGNYEEVVIDVQEIKINYSSDSSSGWQTLSNVNTGLYDVLKLVNDNDTLLADADLEPGRVQQIRLILGNNNYVKVDGQTHNLLTPSAQQSGLKLNIHQDVEAGVLYKLLLDFDASRSIVKTGNGKYILKPVIKTSFESIGGSIHGIVDPGSFVTNVYAIQGPDTIAGTYSSNGSYWLKGLTAGSYNLAFVPSDSSYQQQTVNSVIVNTNQVTTVDTVFLQ